MKLDGEEAAKRYRSEFFATPEFDKAVNRVMARVVRYQENNHVRTDDATPGSGLAHGGTIPVGGCEVPLEDARATGGQPA